ncbi:MAG: hypothetical protein GX591_13045 [Planctomycetes bacterium]|nr:hypothetical protein [Planctomycetota bacterium]
MSPRQTTALEIGVAAQEVVPARPELITPTGMGRLGPTLGILQPPRMEAMAIRAGGELVLMTTGDLRTIPYEWVVRMRSEIAGRTGCDERRILFSGDHNHCFNPIAWGDSPEAADAARAADEQIQQAIIDVCVRAVESLAPAEIAATTVDLTGTIGQCRRVLVSNGTAISAWGSHPAALWGVKIAEPAGPDPTTVGVVAVRRVGETSPFAVLINYDSHPHLCGLRYFSGEIPGGIKRRMERLVPGATCLYAHGTGGNIDIHCIHPMPNDEDEQRTWFERSIELIAERMTGDVLPALATMDYRRPTRLAHLYRSTETEGTGERQRLVMLNALALGDIAFVSMPGEMFLEFGLEIRAGSPFAHTILMGYNGSRQGYVAKPIGYEQGSYETMRGPSTRRDEEDIRKPVILARIETGDEVTAEILRILHTLRA